jgi:hypothetical protein
MELKMNNKPAVTYIKKHKSFTVNPIEKWKAIVLVNARDCFIVLAIVGLFLLK